ncbi:hypothetical protein ALUC_70706S [Aspergillus luchuensis]|nr:hypothetical protein ALUC_70706S [Aspergillus luchuensis]
MCVGHSKYSLPIRALLVLGSADDAQGNTRHELVARRSQRVEQTLRELIASIDADALFTRADYSRLVPWQWLEFIAGVNIDIGASAGMAFGTSFFGELSEP